MIDHIVREPANVRVENMPALGGGEECQGGRRDVLTPAIRRRRMGRRRRAYNRLHLRTKADIGGNSSLTPTCPRD